MKIKLPPYQLHTLADCGNPACNGCYDIGDGMKVHPPRAGDKYSQRAQREYLQFALDRIFSSSDTEPLITGE